MFFTPSVWAQNEARLVNPDRLQCLATPQAVLLQGKSAARWKVESKSAEIKDGGPFPEADKREFLVTLKPDNGACAPNISLAVSLAGKVVQELPVPIARAAREVSSVDARVGSVTTYLCDVSTEILVSGDGLVNGVTVQIGHEDLFVTVLRPGLLSARIPAGLVKCGAKVANATLTVPNQKPIEFPIPVRQSQSSELGIGFILLLGFLPALALLAAYHWWSRRREDSEEPAEGEAPPIAGDPLLRPVTHVELRQVKDQFGDQNRKIWEAVNKLVAAPQRSRAVNEPSPSDWGQTAMQPPRPSVYSTPYREFEEPPAPPPIPPPQPPLSRIQQFIDEYNAALDDNQARKAFRQSWGSRSVAITNQNERRANAQIPPIFGDAAEGDFWVIPAQSIESHLSAAKFLLVPIAGSWGSQRVLDGAWENFFDFEDPRTRQLARLGKPALVAKDGSNWTCAEKGRLL